MTPKGETTYSYYDSPTYPTGFTGVSMVRISAVVICVEPRKWFVIDSVFFSFNPETRGIIVRGQKPIRNKNGENEYKVIGKDPNEHWKEAEKKWRENK